MAIREVSWRPAPECPTQQQFDGLLRNLLLGEMPGFVVRRSLFGSELEAVAVHQHAARLLLASYTELKGAGRFKLCRLGFEGLGQKPIGEFHYDSSDLADDSRPFINTTLTGGGRVVLGTMGSNLERARWLNDAEVEAHHPHNTLQQVFVDDELMSPEVYEANVTTGDSIILREEGSKPTWHRFDTNTALGRRTVAVTTIYEQDPS